MRLEENYMKNKKSYQATEETLIKFLIDKYEKSDTNEVSINKHELPDIG